MEDTSLSEALNYIWYSQNGGICWPAVGITFVLMGESDTMAKQSVISVFTALITVILLSKACIIKTCYF